jgi:Flp pilus assembly protein TadG
MSPIGRHRSRSRGQSLVEFALIVPILLTLLGETLDFARVYEVRVKLEAATRDAAEYAATDMTATSAALVLTRARKVVCAAFGEPATCTSPSVTVVTYTSSTIAPGATTQYPLATVKLTSTIVFHTLLPYPFVTVDGATTLSATNQYAVLRGR